jgi:hypothetical protein
VELNVVYDRTSILGQNAKTIPAINPAHKFFVICRTSKNIPNADRIRLSRTMILREASGLIERLTGTIIKPVRFIKNMCSPNG